MKIKLTADSTCDIPAQLAAQYDVSIIPLYVVMGEQHFKDKIETSPEQVFAYNMQSGRDICHTSAINQIEYVQFFEQFSDYDAILHISLGSKFSSCYSNACLAAAELPAGRVRVIDSGSICVGSALFLEEAIRLQAAGQSLEEIDTALQALPDQLDCSFMITSLESLRKGGRCSSVVELGANLLNIKPCIENRDGLLTVGKKYRGTFEKCVRKYLSDRLEILEAAARPELLYFAHIGCDPTLVNEWVQIVKDRNFFERVEVAEAGCVISTHSGPGAMGLFFLRK